MTTGINWDRLYASAGRRQQSVYSDLPTSVCLCSFCNLYLQTTSPVHCYPWTQPEPLHPPRTIPAQTAHLHYSPDSGIGNLSLLLICPKLQFTWIFVGVLRADCSLADCPATPSPPPSLPFVSSVWEEVFLPAELPGPQSDFFSLTSANISCFLERRHFFPPPFHHANWKSWNGVRIKRLVAVHEWLPGWALTQWSPFCRRMLNTQLKMCFTPR